VIDGKEALAYSSYEQFLIESHLNPIRLFKPI
jgi:hypothetical protein